MNLKKILLCVAVLLLSVSPVLFAQPGDPGADPDNPVPLTGLGYLLAAGTLLGIKKLRDLSRRNK